MQLNGEKCCLDKIQREWLNYEYIDGINNNEVMRYAGFSKTICHSMDTAGDYIEKINADHNKRLFGIYNKPEFDYIGNIRLDIEWMWKNSTISLLIFKKSEWGKGIGSEAIGLITDFAFKHLNLHRVEAGVLDGNTSSIKAFEKNGFQLEGVRRQRRFNEGKYVDEIMLSKLKEDE